MAKLHAHRIGGAIYANLDQLKLMLVEGAEKYKDDPVRANTMLDIKKSLEIWEEGLKWQR